MSTIAMKLGVAMGMPENGMPSSSETLPHSSRIPASLGKFPRSSSSAFRHHCYGIISGKTTM